MGGRFSWCCTLAWIVGSLIAIPAADAPASAEWPDTIAVADHHALPYQELDRGDRPPNFHLDQMLELGKRIGLGPILRLGPSDEQALALEPGRIEVAPRMIGLVRQVAAWILVPLLLLTALMMGWAIRSRRQIAAQARRLKAELAEHQRMVQSLRLSQVQLRLQGAALEAAANAIVITDREGQIQWVNSAFAELTGFPPQEAIGRNPRILRSGAQKTETYADLWRTILAGRVWHGELVNRRKDGGLYHEEQTITPLVDESGEVSHFIAIKMDISERKRIEQALRQSELSFRKAFLEAPFGMLLGTPEGFIQQVNPSFCAMLGYQAAELEGRHCSTVTHPDDVAATAAALRKLALGELSSARWEKRYLHKSGACIWALVSVSRMQGENGAPDYNLVQVVDITERKRAEQELADSEAKYRSLFEESKDVVFVSTRDGRLIDINQAGVELFGYDSKQELLQARIDWDLYWHAEDRLSVTRMIEQQGFVTDLELVLKNKQGRRLTVLESCTAMRDDEGNLVGCRGVLHDITERRELENQLRLSQKLDAVGRLAGGVAHDFNNMLTAILGYADLGLMRLAPEHPARDYFAEIRKVAERSSTLTRQLLAFSRQQVLQPRSLDLNAVIRSFAKLLQRTLGEDVELITELDPGLGSVTADPGSIEQILMSLAVNARDAMPGGGRLTIETFNAGLDQAYVDKRSSVEPGSYVGLAVSDTGRGMDEATQSQIFEPFFTTKERGKGTGLGLSTVYGIIKQSGGYIWAYSEPGQGTSFKIYLPRSVEVASADRVVAPTAAELGGNETILLVEDDAAVRNLTTEILTESGFRVFSAGGFEEAEAVCLRYASQPIDLLITDIVMPGVGGLDLARRVNAIRPGIKVLYMSGYADRAIRSQLSQGAIFLGKPFTRSALVSEVRKAIDRPASSS